MRPALGLLVLVWFVLGPASAQAARPGTLIASGQAPSVAVDGNGTGYVAYNAEPPGQNDEPVGLCVIPRGTTHCSSNNEVIADGNSAEAQPALISASGAGQLTIVSGRCCFNEDEAITSSNGGATWSTPANMGGLTYFDGAIGPSGQVLLVQDNSLYGVYALVTSITSNASNAATVFNPPPGINALAGWAGNVPVVVGAGTETKAAIYSGSGDPNDGANWNNVRVPGSTFEPSMASGPGGLFLLQDTGSHEQRLTIRKFLGNRFGRAHIVVRTNATEGTALAEDPAGHLIAVWYDGGTIYAAASRDQGARWTRPHVVATDVNQPGRMNAALGPGGRGWLVYENLGGGAIRVVALNANKLLGIRAAPKRHKHKPRHHKHRRHHKHHAKHHRHRGKHRRLAG